MLGECLCFLPVLWPSHAASRLMNDLCVTPKGGECDLCGRVSSQAPSSPPKGDYNSFMNFLVHFLVCSGVPKFQNLTLYRTSISMSNRVLLLCGFD